jgi:hypothetical protein
MECTRSKMEVDAISKVPRCGEQVEPRVSFGGKSWSASGGGEDEKGLFST